MIISNQDDDLSRLNEKISKRGQKARWVGWNIVVFRPDHTAAYRAGANENGERPVHLDGNYGWERTVEPDNQGIWKV